MHGEKAERREASGLQVFNWLQAWTSLLGFMGHAQATAYSNAHVRATRLSEDSHFGPKLATACKGE